MFVFPSTDSLSHYEATNRIEERRASVMLLSIFHCGLTPEQQMLILLRQMIESSIRGFNVVGLLNLDIRFANGVGITTRHKAASMAEHAISCLEEKCGNWRALTEGVVFLRVLYRRLVDVNPALVADLRLSNWGLVSQGQQPFWALWKAHMSEQFARIGLARHLMVPLSFDNSTIKFGFATQTEAHRFAALHDSQRQAACPPAPTFRPIAPVQPTMSSPASLVAPVPLRVVNPVLTSLLDRPPLTPAALAAPAPATSTARAASARFSVDALLGRLTVEGTRPGNRSLEPSPSQQQTASGGIDRQIKVEVVDPDYPQPLPAQPQPPPAQVQVKLETAWTQAPEMESPESPRYEPSTPGKEMEASPGSPVYEPWTDDEEQQAGPSRKRKLDEEEEGTPESKYFKRE